VRISLLAQEPLIHTPTGLRVDEQNNIWVIENHTHVRQQDYTGPRADRILVFRGYLDENEEKSISEFATDFVDGMSLSLAPEGGVLVATRASIMQFTDLDGDLKADRRDTLIALETEETFPHNGMSGLVVSPDGWLYFQCGENFGAPYLLTGTDGTTLEGQAREGGSLYRCRADGSRLERIASSVWNCFAMTFDDFGNLFAVENDPDSRPPCRLLHIVKGGDYGFQFQHGRDGLSPFTSWFGQLPGTLPMVAGTAEAPSGVLYYGQSQLHPELQDRLLVTGWGDNEIQSFKLEPKGSSFVAQPQSLIKGERNFYPVGLALDNQGGVLVSDWASVSYPVHGKGRIWRISGKGKGPRSMRIQQGVLLSKNELLQRLNADDPRVRAEAARLVLQTYPEDAKIFFAANKLTPKGKANLLWAARQARHPQLPDMIELALDHEHELLRAAAVRIIAEDQLITNEHFYFSLIQTDASPFVKREAIYGLYSPEAYAAIVPLFEQNDPFIHTAIIHTFGKAGNVDFLLEFAQHPSPHIRLGSLLCLRRSGSERARAVIPDFLMDELPANRMTALKWVAEEQLTIFRNEVEQSFNQLSNFTPELFDTYMATFQYLDGAFNPKSHFMEGDEHISRSFYKRQKFLLAAAANPGLNYDIRRRALAGVNPQYEGLSPELLAGFAGEPHEGFQIEAVRSLGERQADTAALRLLRFIAADTQRARAVRLEAIAALGRHVQPENKTALLALLKQPGQDEAITEEAMRSLEAFGRDEETTPWLDSYRKLLPAPEAAASNEFWQQAVEGEADLQAGERTFFSARYLCSSCHRINGRGGVFGPDLSRAGSNISKERIIQSILDPSAIVQPAYTGYTVKSREGEVFTGRLDKELDSKRHLQMILPNGERTAVPYDQIVEQKMLEQSLMPAGLQLRMTAREFRDLVHFLQACQ